MCIACQGFAFNDRNSSSLYRLYLNHRCKILLFANKYLKNIIDQDLLEFSALSSFGQGFSSRHLIIDHCAAKDHDRM